MKFSLSLLTLSFAAAALAADYECVGTFIFGRHNDRNVKPADILTPLGAQHQYDMGSFFRERYFGMDNSGDTVDSDYKISGLNDYGLYDIDEFYGQAVSANVILFSHLSFLQGLYPPTTITTTNEKAADDVFAELSNGTEILGPLDGYQYVQSYIQEALTPDYIWIKGDVNCPASDAGIALAMSESEFQALNDSTLSYYQSLRDLLPTAVWSDDELNFENAMDIFDYMNVNFIHNSTLAAMWNQSLLDEIRILSDRYNFLTCYNTSQKLSDVSIGGRTLSAAILSQLNTTKTEASPLLNYFTGSFNTMFQFFGLSDLYLQTDNFTGMPDYGSTLVFDLMKKDDDYFVQFSFKNGSTSPYELSVYPLFNSNVTMLPWDDFVSSMQAIAISDLDTWCSTCGATVDMCTVYSDLYEDAESLEDEGVSLSEISNGNYTSLDIKGSSLSNAAAGGIGAGVTIGVFLILGALFYAWKKNSSSSSKEVTKQSLPVAEKRVSHTSSSDNSV